MVVPGRRRSLARRRCVVAGRRFAERTIGALEPSAADVRAPGPKEVGSVSVIPIPAAPERATDGAVEANEPAVSPQLHLVPTHEHTWRLRTVEYDDASLEVRRYECETCADVLFR
jgi:hypothetical protein